MLITCATKCPDESLIDLKKVHKHCADFTISNLIHDTSRENFLSIVQDGLIKPGDKRKNYKNLGSHRISWWGLNISPPETEYYKTNMTKVISEAKDTDSDERVELLSSRPFSHGIIVWKIQDFNTYRGSVGLLQSIGK